MVLCGVMAVVNFAHASSLPPLRTDQCVVDMVGVMPTDTAKLLNDSLMRYYSATNAKILVAVADTSLTRLHLPPIHNCRYLRRGDDSAQ